MFGAPYPGKILPMDLSKLGGTLICQKDAFLCAARGVSLGIHFQQKLSVGFFGGEGAPADGDGGGVGGGVGGQHGCSGWLGVSGWSTVRTRGGLRSG